MKRFISVSGIAVSCFAVTAFAQSPAFVTGNGNMGDIVRGDTFVPPAGTVLMDQLHIVDGQAYFAGNGNCLGGQAIFGFCYDLQLCDDMTVGQSFDLTDVTVDSVTFLGGCPVGMRIGVFADVGGQPDNSYTEDVDWTSMNCSGFTDTIFGLLGVRATASGSSACIGSGHYWVMGQPDTCNGDGDWYYICRGAQTGGDTYMRDGDRGQPGYGWNTWISGAGSGFGSGDASMRVEGNLNCGGGLQLFIASGGCPGSITLQTDGGVPNGRHGYAYSFRTGNWTVPGGPCAGLVLDIVNPTVAAIVPSNGAGSSQLAGNVPPAACGRVHVQSVDVIRGACVKSNLLGL